MAICNSTEFYGYKEPVFLLENILENRTSVKRLNIQLVINRSVADEISNLEIWLN